MVKQTEIGQRLKSYRDRTKTEMQVIAAVTGISVQTLFNWEYGKKPKNIDDLCKLVIYLDKMENNLDEILGNLEYQKFITLRLPLNNNRAAIPQIENTQPLGTIIVSKGEPELIVGGIYSPFLGAMDGIIEVEEDSLSPSYPKGSYIGIKWMNMEEIIDWGRCYYLIRKNGHGIIRKVYRNESGSCLILFGESLNEDLNLPTPMQSQDIKAIFDIVVRINKP
jgi:transcriptional regulator with XRE-family HTH domain